MEEMFDTKIGFSGVFRKPPGEIKFPPENLSR
jgi:hypothetical protein